jgi:deoxyribodipyrimidine photo-lyase
VIAAHSIEEILDSLTRYKVSAYGKTRNFYSGNVSRLSPYISRGVVSTKKVMEHVLRHHGLNDAYHFLFQLAWRDYFQQVWLSLGDDIFNNIKPPQSISRSGIPSAVVKGKTGIIGIDAEIEKLMSSGYMHNHARMYVASIVCNMAQCSWKDGASWMYYHLADADPASNMLSWQWVAGTFSNKKYYANQENINKYANTQQRNTFLDCSYEELTSVSIPKELIETVQPNLNTKLPEKKVLKLLHEKPLYIYNFFNLDPEWRKTESANRILLLEPKFFERFPVSDIVIEFVLRQAQFIDGIQIYTGNFDELIQLAPHSSVVSKSHPSTDHYIGVRDEQEFMFTEVRYKGGSFMRYWKDCEKALISFAHK